MIKYTIQFVFQGSFTLFEDFLTGCRLQAGADHIVFVDIMPVNHIVIMVGERFFYMTKWKGSSLLS